MNEEFLNLKKFKEYFDKLYGKGLYVAGWHMNGNLRSGIQRNFDDEDVKNLDLHKDYKQEDVFID